VILLRFLSCCLVAIACWFGFSGEAQASYRVNFYDGDNLILIQGGIKTKVSLACIDAPELKQPGGQAARKALKSLVDGKQISLRVVNKDRFGRLSAEIFAGGKNINKTLIEAGYVHFNGQWKECDRYQAWERDAKNKQVGIWRSQNSESPAKFRQEGYAYSKNM
jgi:micrococcal nuclease